MRGRIKMEVPDWYDVEEKHLRDEKLDPLEQFVHNNEPAGSSGVKWRNSLQELINFILE